MDVQAVAPTLASTTFSPPLPASTGDVSPVPAAPAPVAPVAESGSSPGSTSSSIPQNAGLALLPPSGGSGAGAGTGSGSGGSTAGDSGGQSLSGNVAKVYNLQEQQVQVSFQVAPGSNETVTVFTDKQSGKVIVQFPSETLIALAQFFQKLDGGGSDNGAVVDKKV